MARTAPTRAQQWRGALAMITLWVGGFGVWWTSGGLAAWITGRGFTPPRLTLFPHGLVGGRPLGVVGAPDRHTWLACGAVLAIGLLLLVRAIVLTAPTKDNANTRPVRKALSKRKVRAAGKWTRPDLPWWRRRVPLLRVPLSGLGWSIGKLRGTRRRWLWASPELRMKVVAPTGWGKTSRLLIPIVRRVPGACLVGSTAGDLFRRTVRARQRGARLPRPWFPLTGTWWAPWTWRPNPACKPWTWGWWKAMCRPGRAPDRPVYVVDFSDPEHRIAAGFPALTWNPIRGCKDLTVALRRGYALAFGTDDGDRKDPNDKFFRESSGDCVAAWFHAADLSGQGMEAVLRWQANIDDQEPQNIIRRHAAGEDVARILLAKHLDDRAAKTTSGVERMLAKALQAAGTRDGQAFLADGPDLEQLVADRGTIYLLASADTAKTVAPLLALFADEWVHTLRSIALATKGEHLPLWALTCLDELRGLTPVASLPAVAARDRKHGHALIYAVQNDGQLIELYGDRAKELAGSTQLALYGGYDEDAVAGLKDRAGRVRVPVVDVDGPLLAPEFDQSGERIDRIDGRDLQNLKEGESIVRLNGADLFYLWTPSFWDVRWLRRRIVREEKTVTAQVAAARVRAAAKRKAAWEAADAAYRADTVKVAS